VEPKLSLLSAPRSERSVRHYYAVDFGRGVAALIVLIWHYQHFFFSTAGVETPSIARSAQPFYRLLRPFYEDGYYAVQFFWMISGFVFAAVYIAQRSSTRSFVVNRVARLYPLHLLTLLVVALLQILSQAVLNHQEIYAHNDLWHFFLNLFFASHWGFEQDYSFNGPIWSVSIEIVIYAAFWITLPYLYRYGIVGPVLLACLCWFLHYHLLLNSDEDALRCGFYFFMGATAFLIVSSFGQRPYLLLLGAGLLGLAGLSVFIFRAHSTDSVGMPLFLGGVLLIFCAIEAAERGHHFRAIRWIGDNTYGTYLWHIPIQIATLIILDRFVGSRAVALQGWFFMAFLAVTVFVARLSFLWVECPAREWIRHKD
jgi:peptidoglycan/LPS O-acetylase OafA/YrhL